MSHTSLNLMRGRTLAFAAVVELGTGFVMMIDPLRLAQLLLGEEISGAGALLGRCFGIALFAQGLACWPNRERCAEGSLPAFRSMLTYNALIALYLAYLGTVGRAGGVLLWPAVAVHAVVGLLLAWTWRPRRAGMPLTE